ncbi:MAG TPA: AraC family transcriptional regulator [Spirochaetota bacterium]|nr:AraC family transcriptional regulator [Spirochaetota bacterium]
MDNSGHTNIRNPMKKEYVSRINRVIDYIENHLDEPMTLDILAGVAHFSPYHFHRIFSSMVGEPLYKFIQRLRLEKAATLLIVNGNDPVTRIAYDCGFSNSSAFARAFREHFGVSAGQWRRMNSGPISKMCTEDRKISTTDSKMWKEQGGNAPYNDDSTITSSWRSAMHTQLSVTVKDMPEMHVAYIRHIGPYKGDGDLFEDLFERICRWAGPRGLLRFPETQFLAVYHDNPDITAEEKLRISICLTVPAGTATEGEIGSMIIPGGKYAAARFELATDEYEAAWNAVYGEWLPESGYQPDDRLPFELYINDPKEHPEGKCIVDIFVPVKPL